MTTATRLKQMSFTVQQLEWLRDNRPRLFDAIYAARDEWKTARPVTNFYASYTKADLEVAEQKVRKAIEEAQSRLGRIHAAKESK